MGKIVAYLGPETEVARPVEGGSYSLVQQADECPDGFGLGWYPLDGQPDPIRLRCRAPLRNADHVLEAPRRYRSSCILACARSEPGGAAELSGVQPFVVGRHLFAFEGKLDRFEQVFLRSLLSQLSEPAFSQLGSLSPAEVIFSLWSDALQNADGPDAMANALENVIGKVQSIATSSDASAAMTVVASDGTSLLAVRTATHGPPPPLYTTVAVDQAAVPATGRVVGSEPTFPGQWESIDAHALTIFTVEPADAAAAPA